MNTQTTRALIGEFIDAKLTQEIAESSGDEVAIKEAQEEIDEITTLIRTKADNIDGFANEITRKEALLDAEIEVTKGEIKRMQGRKQALAKLQEYFNKTLLPMIIEEIGKDGVLETSRARYKLYETWGPIGIVDQKKIPDEYKKMVYEEKIDKAKARKEMIRIFEKKMLGSQEFSLTEAFSLSKVKRVRRS